ncbi:MAG: GGDEF domain-containing protein [Novosphingobium pentaromativorans]|uniref:GGDEF domain-containing protein n=1 Tax=Novosphingobium pentaromativorans TaxID=205844 RepID=A0A2W5NES5_9SPHN|nr:MAG: GGDEF domain-containing protein [Novosphingobium pentaromativorans]
MLVIFLVCFMLIYQAEQDRAILLIGAAALLTWIFRIEVARRFRQRALTGVIAKPEARRLELAFAVPYVGFAVLLGAFGARVFALPDPEAHMLTICTIMGFCAGVVTGVGRRPAIANLSLLGAAGPVIVMAALRGTPLYTGLALITAAYLVGGMQALKMRFEIVKAEIGKRLLSVSLARSDSLTALPNRLALREYFDENARLISSSGLIAVHYLDLNGFKPVNDDHGHTVGDMLLALVADRLRGAIRSGDIVARLGGDEFAVLQYGLHRSEEAEFLAQRLVAAIGQPFHLADLTLSITASIGTVVTGNGRQDLAVLLDEADARLYLAKRGRTENGQKVVNGTDW